MERRQLFLSDYERYNPVQNMHMLATHVFDLSESMLSFRHEVTTDFATSRRMLDFVKENQRESNETQKIMGEDLGLQREDVRVLKEDVGMLKAEMGELKDDVADLKIDVGALKEDVGALKEDVGMLKLQMDYMRQEQQKGFDELKMMIQMIATMRR